MDYGIVKKMPRPVEYLLDRKYIGFAMKLFHRASRKDQRSALQMANLRYEI